MGARGVGAPKDGGQNPEKSGEPKGGGRKGGGQKGWSPERVEGPKGGGSPQFRAFFPLPLQISPFFSLSGVFSLNCGLGLKVWTTQTARLGFYGVILCEPRRPTKKHVECAKNTSNCLRVCAYNSVCRLRVRHMESPIAHLPHMTLYQGKHV